MNLALPSCSKRPACFCLSLVALLVALQNASASQDLHWTVTGSNNEKNAAPRLEQITTPHTPYTPSTPNTPYSYTPHNPQGNAFVVPVGIEYDVMIDTHYAKTTMTHTFRNDDSEKSHLFEFDASLPIGAYISGYEMTVGDETFTGIVLEWSEALDVFESAVSAGVVSGVISEQSNNELGTDFSFSVNIPASTIVAFQVTYEQLIARRLGWFDYSLDLVRSDLRITNARVNMYITEPDGILSFEVLNPVDPDPTYIISPDGLSLNLEYPPAGKLVPLNRDILLVVRYKTGIPLEPVGSFITDVESKYFVHLFSPPDILPFPKALVFVLDKSGSMSGTKFEQLQEAVLLIIEQLDQNDYFNFVYFDSVVYVWRERLQPATESNKDDAATFVNSLDAGGTTNINDALISGINLLEEASEVIEEPYAFQLIFLTDGQANVGESTTDRIRENVRCANDHGFSIHAIGLGQNLDFELIRTIALENSGFERRISVEENVLHDITFFFDEIDSTVLSEVELSYSSDSDCCDVEGVTASSYLLVFDGSEIIVAGIVPEGASTITASMSGKSVTGLTTFEATFNIANAAAASQNRGSLVPTENLWAFLTLNDLRDKIDLLEFDEPELVSALEEEAFQLSMQYGFVTEWTSLLVVPDICLFSDDVEECAGNTEVNLLSINDAAPLIPRQGLKLNQYTPTPGYTQSQYSSYVKDAPCLTDISIRDITRTSCDFYTILYCNDGFQCASTHPNEAKITFTHPHISAMFLNLEIPEVGECLLITVPCDVEGSCEVTDVTASVVLENDGECGDISPENNVLQKSFASQSCSQDPISSVPQQDDSEVITEHTGSDVDGDCSITSDRLVGLRIKTESLSSVDSCCALCLGTSDCVVWAIDERKLQTHNATDCIIMSTETATERARGWISGRVEERTETQQGDRSEHTHELPADECTSEPGLWSGNVIDSLEDVSKNSCCQHCEHDEECEVWQWNSKTHRCKHFELAVPISGARSSGWVRGRDDTK